VYTPQTRLAALKSGGRFCGASRETGSERVDLEDQGVVCVKLPNDRGHACFVVLSVVCCFRLGSELFFGAAPEPVARSPGCWAEAEASEEVAEDFNETD
jgi:hypothetical protein